MHWLYSSPCFELITDHQPLGGIFKKELGEIPNRRLQRFREKILDYPFEIKWVGVKRPSYRQCLSHAPVDVAVPEELADWQSSVSVIQSLDLQLDSLCQAATESES